MNRALILHNATPLSTQSLLFFASLFDPDTGWRFVLTKTFGLVQQICSNDKFAPAGTYRTTFVEQGALRITVG